MQGSNESPTLFPMMLQSSNINEVVSSKSIADTVVVQTFCVEPKVAENFTKFSPSLQLLLRNGSGAVMIY